MQLQAACDKDLRQRVFDTGNYASLTTEDAFLSKMKELAVIVIHKSIHLRNLWKTVQQPDEPVRAFVARAMSTADMCNMEVECPNQTKLPVDCEVCGLFSDLLLRVGEQSLTDPVQATTDLR